MFKLNAKFDPDLLLCDGHTAHVLTQQCLPAPQTTTVKGSLFTHVHSGPQPLGTLENFSTIRMNEILLFETTLLDIEGVMLNEVRQRMINTI